VPLATMPTAISGIYVSRNCRTPYVQQHSLGMQWEVFRDWMAEIGYVGAKGTKLVNVYTLNQGDSPPTAPYGAALRAVHPHRPSAQPNGFAQRFDPVAHALLQHVRLRANLHQRHAIRQFRPQYPARTRSRQHRFFRRRNSSR
jgi:hypothetical protein